MTADGLEGARTEASGGPGAALGLSHCLCTWGIHLELKVKHSIP